MALFPIIYLSILITSILIVTVVLFSYITSKIRNKNNGERILAIAYNATTSRNKGRGTKIVVQKRKHSKKPSYYNDRDLYARNKREHTNLNRDTGFENNDRKEIKNRSYAGETRTYSPERRMTSEGFRKRVEIINQTKSDSRNFSQGQDRIRNSDTLYFYSAKNDQQFYSIKAS